MESRGLMSGNNEELKIGGSEYHNTYPDKSFNSSYWEIKINKLNKGIAIMIIIIILKILIYKNKSFLSNIFKYI